MTVALVQSLPTNHDVVAAAAPSASPRPMARRSPGCCTRPTLRPAPGVVLVHMLGRSKDEWALHGRASAGSGRHGPRDRPAGARQFGRIGAASRADGRRRRRRHRLARGSRRTSGRRRSALVGASLGANLAALAAADKPAVRAVALISPSLDYRGVRLDAGTMKKLGASRSGWPPAPRIPTRCGPSRSWSTGSAAREQRLSSVARARSRACLRADPDLAGRWWTGFDGR